ncbi:MAG: hypothetical protein B6D35_11670 [Candidatus Brocadia sp. UTAMX2]|nr:MAG: hypothetical protein B6D35_11670 [Candidatus Brocadia sp. UTAMX2]
MVAAVLRYEMMNDPTETKIPMQDIFHNSLLVELVHSVAFAIYYKTMIVCAMVTEWLCYKK